MSRNLLLKPTLLKFGAVALSALICVCTINVCSASSRYKTTITAVSSDEIRVGADRNIKDETSGIKQKLVIGFLKKGESLNKAAQRQDKIEGEYRQSAHIWIINDEGKFLMQKRSKDKKKFAGKWSQTGGAVDEGKTSLQGALRECKEELGIDIKKEEIEKTIKDGETTPNVVFYFDILLKLIKEYNYGEIK